MTAGVKYENGARKLKSCIISQIHLIVPVKGLSLLPSLPANVINSLDGGHPDDSVYVSIVGYGSLGSSALPDVSAGTFGPVGGR